ncbi:caspase domain-containing protein [Cyathus striatus]|nr:caspase domain-containing protein [Cyathus striatus]
MKVVRHRPLRRRAFRSPSIAEEAPVVLKSGKRRALLIGIRYTEVYDDPKDGKKEEKGKERTRGRRGCAESKEEEGEDSDSESGGDSEEDSIVESVTTATTVEWDGVLLGPHRDVLGMKGVLIEKYGYKEDDITVMMDDENVREELKPTMANILVRMDELVKDALPGDCFFFHFSGHSTQQPSERMEDEEDGQDEYIVTSDDQLIKDDGIRALDIKGHRRSMTQWNRNVRKDAADIPTLRQSASKMLRKWKPTSLDKVLRPSPSFLFFSIFPSLSRSPPLPFPPFSNPFPPLHLRDGHKKTYFTTEVEKVLVEPKNGFRELMWKFVSLETVCDGWCASSERGGGWGSGADVCSFLLEPWAHFVERVEGWQKAWERANGDSMTQVLIRLLEKNPNPTLHDLLLSLSHDIHRFYLDLHRHSKDYKKRLGEEEEAAGCRGG